MATRSRKRRFNDEDMHYPPAELAPISAQKKPIEVIVVHSQSPPPYASTSYQQPARYNNHVSVAAAVPGERFAYGLPTCYTTDMSTAMHPPAFTTEFIPTYPQLPIPTAAYLPPVTAFPPPANHINSAYYHSSSPADSSRSYPTTEASSRPNSAGRRLPPTNSYTQRVTRQHPPVATDYIDLTNSPPGSIGVSAPKRRKKDNYYEPQQQQQPQPQQPIISYPPQQFLPPPPRVSPVRYNDGPYYREQDLPSCADKEGHFIVTVNSDLTSRYKIMRLLGQGTFGKVVEAYDRQTRQRVAIKVIRAVQKYRDASKVEIRVLNALKTHDPENRKRCIHLQETFDYRNHICMVFELLSQSVFDFLKENAFAPFPPWQIKAFATQILEAVAFLHDLGLVHTDLKPENLMLVDNQTRVVGGSRRSAKARKELLCTSIRLIDFGSAIFEEDYHSSVVSTRHYRAPEIILCTGWSFPCDMWSVGCILVEFCTGDALFQTHDNLEHLAMMEAVLGKFPEKIIRSVGKASQKYFRNNRLDWPNSETQKQSKRFVKNMKPLRDIIRPQDDIMESFLDLVQQMLVYDPRERITARQALQHQFFRMDIPGAS
ncbi:CMGC/CLK protein kinase [Spizellomyces punctatus DAOM BR117]|uniref:CMGC/CLK protein kinase n=1 Tax=Spizellomyces punctatus (strain DAOM BR117) TaxID=645134 RepID=A0A0L0HCJ7_SPIPD|nr:CMGC/CLK protein kinase [Spizellomyces punctatus DAOM BR117]KNC98912.1 CMGC/CLK protein kinase [Spizellomyces punctatus DAOM BR117]|eukprot:XP_016606952.1 CMGC/CLK protein kinase [Spizellomyces punctatus DAOM BR117]